MQSNQAWLDFLKTQGAVFDNEHISAFNHGISLQQTYTLAKPLLCELSHLGVIHVSGDDAGVFLQNQLSNDINQLNASGAQIAAHCSPKGRVLTLFTVIQFDAGYYLLLPRERIAATLKRLQMYVLRSKVLLQDKTAQLAIAGIISNTQQNPLTTLFDDLPQRANEVRAEKNTLLLKPDDASSRYIIIGTTENLINLWTSLADKCQPSTHAVWRYFDIQFGVPQVYEANADEFVPQMLNLHAINGISFSKGCYPGQEVVARMHYLGKLKRRMYSAHSVDPSPPCIGDNVYDENNQTVGKIVDAQPAAQGGYDVLAVLQVASAENGKLYLKLDKTSAITLKDLPYGVELERQDKPQLR